MILLAGCATNIASVAPTGDLELETLQDGSGAHAGVDSTIVETTPPPAPAATDPAPTTTSTTSTTSTSTSTTSTSTTTTTTEPELPADVANPTCVRIASSPALDQLAAEARVPVVTLWIENGFRDDFRAGDLVDVCADNGVDDVTGEAVLRHDHPAVADAIAANVERQQSKLNELFDPYGTRPLAVDGISGPITGQRLCAARVALGFDATVDDMQPGSQEQAALFAATELPTPASPVTDAARWALIDRTCQMMFVGAGPKLVFAFPTSTGTEGYETRIQDRARVFRYNPAVENGGWHDSTEFPVGVDNPLNGNLYKPLYFDLGQAIHGANNVPTVPASKGCARLTVDNQELLLAWLGLLDATEETWLKNEIDLTVSVQGEFAGRESSSA